MAYIPCSFYEQLSPDDEYINVMKIKYYCDHGNSIYKSSPSKQLRSTYEHQVYKQLYLLPKYYEQCVNPKCCMVIQNSKTIPGLVRIFDRSEYNKHMHIFFESSKPRILYTPDGRMARMYDKDRAGYTKNQLELWSSDEIHTNALFSHTKHSNENNKSNSGSGTSNINHNSNRKILITTLNELYLDIFDISNLHKIHIDVKPSVLFMHSISIPTPRIDYSGIQTRLLCVDMDNVILDEYFKKKNKVRAFRYYV